MTDLPPPPRPLLGRGERAPDFALPRADGTSARFYALAGGRPAVLVLCPSADAQQVEAAREAAGEAASVHVVARARGAGPHGAPEGTAPGGTEPTLLLDDAGQVSASYRVADGTAATYVLDANLRVLDASAHAPDVDWITRTLAGAGAGAGPGPGTGQPDGEVAVQAPVLYVPRVLDDATCAALIDVWETQGNVDTGVERSAQGRRSDTLNPSAKRRRDHTVTDPDLLRRLTGTVGRRVMPELRKAFAYRATRFEGFKIACYDAEAGGFFTAHRDNLSPATAHRRFALTLNLNRDYDGGHLRFPEYSAQRYRPAAGEALIFSCSHLHEVLPVTRGRRFVLLSFLFADEQARPT